MKEKERNFRRNAALFEECGVGCRENIFATVTGYLWSAIVRLMIFMLWQGDAPVIFV